MLQITVKRFYTHAEEIWHEFGPVAEIPLQRGFAAAVIDNPYAGRYVTDIMPLMESLSPLGLELANRLVAALDVSAGDIEGYGKGALIGAAGELEHGALWHAPGGYAMREVLGWKEAAPAAGTARVGAPGGQAPGNALSIVPSTKKVGPAGAALDVPMTHINASYVRSHFDAIEVRVPGAPRANEMVLVLAMSTGPRIHARSGGLKSVDISKWDGQR